MHCRKTMSRGDCLQARKRVLTWTWPCWHSDLQPSELWENKFLFFEPPRLRYFVMAVRANQEGKWEEVPVLDGKTGEFFQVKNDHSRWWVLFGVYIKHHRWPSTSFSFCSLVFSPNNLYVIIFLVGLCPLAFLLCVLLLCKCLGILIVIFSMFSTRARGHH